MGSISRSAVVVFLATILLNGCGNWFVDESIINKAKKDASRPGLSSREKARIYEEAGDATRRNGQGGFAADLYFDAANEYNGTDGSGDNDVLRVYDKCNKSNSACRSIKELIIDDWRTRAPSVNQASRNNRQASADSGASRSSGGTSSAAASGAPDIDAAIAQAKAVRASTPKQIDGCNTGLEHLRDKLPICRDNVALMKMRELWLLSDASFKENLAAGATMAQIATEQARLAREFESNLQQNEAAMQSAAADGQRARRRVEALAETPSRCDAGPQDQFGMQEQAYQAYVNAYMAVLANRALSAIAACRARAGK